LISHIDKNNDGERSWCTQQRWTRKCLNFWKEIKNLRVVNEM
jgi:hypothetical protein